MSLALIILLQECYALKCYEHKSPPISLNFIGKSGVVMWPISWGEGLN